jgi:hypothetical protein
MRGIDRENANCGELPFEGTEGGSGTDNFYIFLTITTK